jgi:hypothetical protein
MHAGGCAHLDTLNDLCPLVVVHLTVKHSSIARNCCPIEGRRHGMSGIGTTVHIASCASSCHTVITVGRIML